MVKRIIRYLLIFLGTVISISLLAVGSIALYYYSIVSQKPGSLQVSVNPGDLGKYVNTFIGTGGYPWVCGNDFPGASMPFGMVRLSPDTESIFGNQALNTSGYFYGDNKIMGFSHTRLCGTGATDGGHFRVVPAVGSNPWLDYQEGKYAHFSHRDEIAFPGYYAVKLKREHILTELTASVHTGVHRYTFSGDQQPHILIDVCSVLGDKKKKDGEVKIISGSRQIEGSVRTFGTFAGRYGGIKVYFVAQFDQDFASFGIWNGKHYDQDLTSANGDSIGVDLAFDRRSTNQVIGLKLAISLVSIDNARDNLQEETTGKSFNDMVREAKAAWEKKLSAIRIKGATDKQKTIFYTALYRTFQMPTVFQDCNGEYLGFDSQVHQATGFTYYTDMSLWDTFRTLHPLYTLIAPEEQRDMLVSLVKMKEQGGWLPRWPSGNGYTGSMLGSPADMVISESYQKGIRDFDIESAYQGMKEVALHPTPKGSAYSGRRGIGPYIQYHYCPSDLMTQSVGRTLEYAWADDAIAKLAHCLGYKEDAEMFYEHSRYYRNTWNPQTRFFQPRNSKGGFDPFKPKLLSYFDPDGVYTNDYVEGSALQWRWAIPFDPQGLIELFGGKNALVEALNDFYEHSDPTRASWNPGPYYWHGNEPDIATAYLFNAAGRPDLTQKWVRWILDNKYDVTPNGIDGNNDGGTLSAWYIFSALGFYPIAGSDIYELGAPLFEEAEVKVRDKVLKITARHFAPENMFAKKVWFDDTLLTTTRIHHKDLAISGTLLFDMSPQ